MLQVITQDMAREALEKLGRNRKITPSVVERYATEMREGRWRDDLAPPILLDRTTYAIIDGQHRLKALLELPPGSVLHSEIKLVDFDAIEVIDTGKPRSLVDTLTILGKPHAYQLSALLNTSSYWATGVKPGKVMSRTQQVAWLNNNPHAEKAAEVGYGFSAGRTKYIYRVPIGTTTTLWDIAEYGAGGDTVVDFITELQTGNTTHPQVSRLLRRLLEASNKRSKTMITIESRGFMIARSYVAWLNDLDLSKTYARRNTVQEIPGWTEWVKVNWPDLDL